MTTLSNTRTAALPFAMPAPTVVPQSAARPASQRRPASLWRVWWSVREFFWQAWLVVR